MKEIGIFVNSFLRDDLLPRFVDSCEKFIPKARIYITDNGRMNGKKQKYYEELNKKGHIIYIPGEFNYWWRKGFNDKIKMVQEEKYILKIDDDFVFNEKSNIENFINILEKNKDIGLIGGQVWHERNNKKSDFIFKVVEEQKDGVFKLKVLDYHDKDLVECDYTPDFWLARKELFDCVKMREDLKPAEGGHELFFRDIYTARKSGKLKLKIAYTDKTIAFHEKSGNSEEYKKYRYGGYDKNTYKKNIKMVL